MKTKAIFSKKSDNWATPPELYIKLHAKYNFNYDPCPLNSKNLTGLLIPWGRRVFVNPPYSKILQFMEKAIIEIKNNRSEIVVFLVPPRTDTIWFHTFVLGYNAEIQFIKGRLKFGNSEISAPFPSILCIFTLENINGKTKYKVFKK